MAKTCEKSKGLEKWGKWLSIDPSIRNMGWCLWDKDRPKKWGSWRPKMLGLGDWDDDWKVKARDACEFVMEMVTGYDCSGIVIEMPRHFGGGGKAEAAKNSGAILKMYYLIGMLDGLVGVGGVDFVTVPVEVWKGQTPKEITQRRVMKDYGIEGDHNMVDAVGIGRWYVRTASRKGKK